MRGQVQPSDTRNRRQLLDVLLNSCGRNDAEGYGPTRDEAIADYNRKQANAEFTGWPQFGPSE